MNPLVPLILGLIGAVVSGLAAYFVAKRQRSGKIATTEAETLWAEGAVMRQELRDETVALRAEVVTMRTESVTMRSEAVAMRLESAAMREEMIVLRQESLELRKVATDCRHEVALLRQQLRESKEQP